MHNIQETFNKVIESGFYPMDSEKPASCNLMCLALLHAKITHVISHDTYITTVDATEEYLEGFPSLRSFLKEHGHEYDGNACLTVFKDWENRPKIPYMSYGK